MMHAGFPSHITRATRLSLSLSLCLSIHVSCLLPPAARDASVSAHATRSYLSSFSFRLSRIFFLLLIYLSSLLSSLLSPPCSLLSCLCRARHRARSRMVAGTLAHRHAFPSAPPRTVPHRRAPTPSFPPCLSCAQPRVYIHGPFPLPHTGSLLEKRLHTTLCAKPRVYIYERPP